MQVVRSGFYPTFATAHKFEASAKTISGQALPAIEFVVPALGGAASSMVTISYGQRKNSIEFDGRLYATLDFVPPSAKRNDGFEISYEFAPMPLGWSLAPSEHGVIENVIAKYRWAAPILVLEGSKAYATISHNAKLPGQLVDYPAICHITEDLNRYRVCEGSPARILIRTTDKVIEPCVTLGADLWEQKLFTDCTIVTSDERLECHRAVLARASPVFKSMFESNMREAIAKQIELKELPSRVAVAMLRFMYVGELRPGEEDVFELFALADKYNIEALALACYPFVMDRLSTETVGNVARTLKNFSERPQFQQVWASFCSHLQKHGDLLSIAMKGL